jgi:hypothetical protein
MNGVQLKIRIPVEPLPNPFPMENKFKVDVNDPIKIFASLEHELPLSGK